MTLSVKGYLLEPPRVGGSNSAFTLTPNNLVKDQGAFDSAYPADESVPRTEYCVFVLKDTNPSGGNGPNSGRSLIDARFAWTKNEGIQRFDYAGRDGRFKPLVGAPPVIIGTLNSDANTNRIKVDIPVSQDLVTCPVRIGLGFSLTGSDTTFPVTLVQLDSQFSVPTIGTVQLSMETGNLNWNLFDIQTGYPNAYVRYHRQTYYTSSESTGLIGTSSQTLRLSPLPNPDQHPLIRVGFGEYLTPSVVSNDGAFASNPPAGTVQWSASTGRLKFNSSVVTSDSSIYYDGTVFEFGIGLFTSNIGTVNNPTTFLSSVFREGGLFFMVPTVVQFAEVQFVDTLTTPGKKGVVQVRRSTGQVLFSDADKASYGTYIAKAVSTDLVIERGIVLRLFRCPVNIEGTDPTLKDVTAIYSVENANLANPIIGAPMVSLPSVPLDTYPIDVVVKQGTGSFTGALPRLDVPNPLTGVGFVFNFDKRELAFAQRMPTQTINAPVPYGGAKLPHELLYSNNFEISLETLPNSGVFNPLVVGQDVLVDYQSGLVTMVGTKGIVLMSGTLGVIVGSTFSEAGKNFVSIPAGSQLVVSNGLSEGVYNVVSSTATQLNLDVSGITFDSNLAYEIREPAEILADRYFHPVVFVDPTTKVERVRLGGVCTNSPRQSVDLTTFSRIRLGFTTYANVVYLSSDAEFSDPSVLSNGFVELSQATGNLNFNSVNLGSPYYVNTLLKPSVDYVLQDALGFVQLTDRLLTNDELVIRYKDSSGITIEEQATFSIFKETVSHPVVTDEMSFNPEGKRVSPVPSPRVFRGGRPQSSKQVLVDTVQSKITFVAAQTVTDALPSGSMVSPSERVLVDYYIYNAIGGEKTFTVLKPPIATSKVVIKDGFSSFEMEGDYSSTFASGMLMLINSKEMHSIQSVAFSSGLTTITLSNGESFQDDYVNPKVFVTSGIIADTYFLTEVASRPTVPRGMNRFLLSGDLSRRYTEGVVVYFLDGFIKDYYYVSGSTYDKESDTTTVVILSNTLKQYSTSVTLKRSLRAIMLGAPNKFSTTNSVVFDKGYQIFRKMEGQVGDILTQPDEYSIDGAGTVTLTQPLTLGESVQAYYTGNIVIPQGQRLRTTYTCTIVPTASNGLLNQILTMSYTTYQPDSFFWRVETITNFRGELAEKYSSEATSGSTSGPMLSNMGGTKLYKQGRESIFFQEGYLANEDLVARATLKFYNNVVGYTESLLKLLDGKVVGDHDGSFLFDGNTDNPDRTTFGDVTNQIDDRFKVSPAPYVVTGPPFITTSVGTYQLVYQPSSYSRFYPTARKCFGVVTAPVSEGDPILDLGVKKISSVSNVVRRTPWAVVTVAASSGATTLLVDDANGSTTLLRPAFQVGMKVAIIAQNGTTLVSDGASLTLTSVSSGSLGLGSLPVGIPIGATVRLATNDTVYAKSYRLGVDFGVDLERGLLTYLGPTSFWGGLTNPPSVPAAGEILDVDVAFNNQLTEPYRFPALDGSPLDDDNNRQFPILHPSVVTEPSLLTVEEQVINPTTGTIRSLVTDSYVSTGSLNVAGNVITNLSGNWPSPAPQVGDLVEIRTGANSPSSFKRITSTTSTTIQVDSTFPVPNVSGFTFAVTSCTSLESGSATSGSTTSLTDTGANFSSVVPGHTLVLLSGLNIGMRRQISASTTTTLTCEAFPNPILVGTTYRVVNSIATFGKVGTSLTQTTLAPNINSQIGVLSDELNAVEGMLSEGMDVKTTSVNGQTSGSTLTSIGQSFTTTVDTTCYVYIRSGVNAGIYPIQSVISDTQVQIAGSFPAPVVGIAYNIMRPSGVSKEFLEIALGIALNVDTRMSQLNGFNSVLLTPVSVTNDSGSFATRLTINQLNTEYSSVASRVIQIPDIIGDLDANLSTGDRLYDSRFVWIDTRINLEKGTLVMRDLAASQREKKLVQMKNQMQKILSVRG